MYLNRVRVGCQNVLKVNYYKSKVVGCRVGWRVGGGVSVWMGWFFVP